MRPTRSAALAVVLALGLLNLALVPGVGSTSSSESGRAPKHHVTGPRAGEPVDIAIDHVQEQPQRYGVTRDDVEDLTVTSAYRSRHNRVTHVYLRQRVHGLDVLGAEMTVNVAHDGSIIHIGNRFLPVIGVTSGRQVLGPAQAVRRAADALGLGPPRDLRLLSSSTGASRESVLSEGGISLQPIPARLVYQPAEDGRIRLAWNLEIEEISQDHWWNASIDAENGDLVSVIDYTDHDDAEHTAAAVATRPEVGEASSVGRAITVLGSGPSSRATDGSSYRVFALPLESPNDGPRTLEEEPADAVASPYGWHDTNGQPGPEYTVTQGNNVSAYLDTTNAGMPLPGTQAEGFDDLTFDYPWDPALPPTVTKDAAVTNLFYWNNIVHDVFYHYGFDEPAGNFQVNNYGRGGQGNDDVRAEAQDGSGVNNANFSTPPDGSRPRMQMYVWTTGATSGRIIDGDMDAGVIVHEYGHGISHRLTGGPNTTACLGGSIQERPSEGWSDWLAIAMLALETESGPQRRGMGTYVLNQPNRQGTGIRPTAYSTNMSINGATYNSIRTLAVPHGVGYVWATITWETFWDLVDKHGFNPNVYDDWTTGGNNLAIQLIMDGMKFQPCSPGFVDARDGILAADVALTDGENQCVLWRGFAKRGLGYSAIQGTSTSRTDNSEAFDTHPDCRPQIEVSPGSLDASVPAGGSAEATLAIANLALQDGQALEWGITEAAAACSATSNLGWVSADPAGGSTAAAGASEVTVSFDATGLDPGSVHTGLLCVGSSDANRPITPVSLRLEVE